MELINTTCADVVVELTAVDGFETQKAARVLGKLTFAVERDGRLELVADDPVPVMRADEETACGIQPRDTGGFAHDGVELLVNGAAHAPGGRPTPQMDVSLAVGDRVHRALVSGDRVWIGRGDEARASEPAPFRRMPLTYDRAFGGTADVWLDPATVVPVQHPANPLGRGFDLDPMARALVEQLGGPPDFPRHDYVRALPNLEDARAAIRTWRDAPRPYCWSARPMTAAGWVDLSFAEQSQPPASGEVAPPPPWAAEVATTMRMRCHPELLLEGALTGVPIVLSGMTPDGVLGFYFPAAAIDLDYEIDERSGTRRLELRRVVLLPEERRFTALYETKFRFEARADGQRSLRVRLAGTA